MITFLYIAVWDLKTDCFIFTMFQVPDAVKPFICRGVLLTKSDHHLWFEAPVTIQGKFILRDLSLGGNYWDSSLPQNMKEAWDTWHNSLQELRHLQTPRTQNIRPQNLQTHPPKLSRQLLISSFPKRGVSFVMGKVNLAPLPEHTIPRLELCAAVLAVEVADLISSHLRWTWILTPSLCTLTARWY